jgi:YD repeat-containing protein
VAILTWLVQVDAMMGVLDGGYRQTDGSQQRQNRDEQGRLTAARTPDDSQDFQTMPSGRWPW